MTLAIERRPVYSIQGDYRVWRYLTLHAALRRLALRKLAKKYPCDYDAGDWEVGIVPSWDSEITYEHRCALVKRYVRLWKPVAKLVPA